MPQQPSHADAGQIGNSRFIIFDKWSKMNTKVARQNLPDDQLSWLENLQPIAENVLQTIPGPLPALATLGGETVSRFFYANIGNTDYIIAFTLAGAGIAINAGTGATTTFAADGTFSATPDMVVFSSQRLLIMDPTAGYVTWDGTLLVKSGGISPNIHVTAGGAGYTSPPAVSFTGGAGNNAGGAAATAVLAGGSVVAINVTNPGTGNAAGAAIVVVLTGGGFSSAATATVVVWPQVTGQTIAIFGGRVWWAQGRILNFTGTGSTTGQTYDDINPADAAGSTTITDYDLAHTITAIRALNNFLYIFGDQSIKQIASLTVQSSVTLFTLLTLASDVGTSFMMTIVSYNRLVLFANKNGVYGIFGATVQKISDDLDGIFQLVDFSLQPSAGLNDFHVNLPNTGGGSIHCFMLLLKYNDPIQGARSIIVVYQSGKWFVVSQGSLIAIAAVPLALSTQWETFGSSGSDVTHLLQSGAVPVNIRLQTALSAHGNMVMAKQPVRSGVAVTTTTAQNITLTLDTENGSNNYAILAASIVTWINNSGGMVQFRNQSLQNVNFIAGGFRFPHTETQGYGRFIGNTVIGTGVTNLAINGIVDEYTDADLWGEVP